VHLLRQFLDDASGRAPIPDGHPYRGIHAMPRGEISTGPELWMLGSGINGAIYAGELGLPFSHAYFINPEGSEDAVATYRERFKPSVACPRPRVSIGVAALAAETEDEVRVLATSRNLWVVRLLTGRPIPFPSPKEAKDYPFTDQELALLRTVQRRSIVGTPEQVRAGLLALADAHDAEELVVVTITYDYASRLRSYELLAKAFALTPTSSP
jgi:luciferase family oxidoreductase group 1